MRRALAIGVVLVALLPATAAAEWHFTPLVGLTFKSTTNIFDAEQAVDNVHKNVGGAVSLLGDGILGVEAIGVWTPALFQSDDNPLDTVRVDTGRAVAFMGNVMVTTPRLWTEFSLRPYLSGGAGLIHAKVTQEASSAGGPPLDLVRLNAPGYNLGVGAIGFLSERTGVRFDVRYYSTFRRSGDVLVTLDPDVAALRYMTVTIGVVFRR